MTNAYFLKFISAASGGTVINFSDRFTLKSMAGTFPAAVQQGLSSISGTAGPADQNNVGTTAAAGATATVPVGADVYNTPYTLQSGTIRYAPMPPMAQTSITAKSAAPLFPTSAYTVYPTIAGTPNAITTNTLALTFSASSRENPVRTLQAMLMRSIANLQQATPAGQPTDGAVQKFLNRWKD